MIIIIKFFTKSVEIINCGEGKYYNRDTNSCSKCSKCENGFTYKKCENDKDTVCKICYDDQIQQEGKCTCKDEKIC